MKLNHEIIGLGLLLGAGASAVVAQAPEVFDCHTPDGRSATTWVGGDIEFPHCDGKNMSDLGNTIHGTAKGLTIVLALSAAAIGIEQSRKRKTHHQNQLPNESS